MSACVGFIVVMWCIAQVSANHQAVLRSLVEVRLLARKCGCGSVGLFGASGIWDGKGECRVLQKLENLTAQGH